MGRVTTVTAQIMAKKPVTRTETMQARSCHCKRLENAVRALRESLPEAGGRRRFHA
jgi:hypothetical protein